MHVTTPGDAAAFLEATAAYRAADPVRTNVLGSVATGVLQGRAYDAEHWFVVHDGDAVVGAAIWTVPYRLLLAPMPEAAAAALGAVFAGVSVFAWYPITPSTSLGDRCSVIKKTSTPLSLALI